MKFGKARQAFTVVVAAIGFLSFFLPLISIQAPILGKMDFSPLNIVSRVFNDGSQNSPSFSDVTHVAKEIGKNATSDSSSPPSPQTSASLPLGIRLIPFVPLEVAVAYISMILIVLGALFNPILRNIRVAAATGMVASGVALISLYLASDAIQSSMTAGFNTPDMQNNPFASLGEALAQSIRVNPGLGIYLLVGVMAVILVLCQLHALDRLSIQPAAATISDPTE